MLYVDIPDGDAQYYAHNNLNKIMVYISPQNLIHINMVLNSAFICDNDFFQPDKNLTDIELF